MKLKVVATYEEKMPNYFDLLSNYNLIKEENKKYNPDFDETHQIFNYFVDIEIGRINELIHGLHKIDRTLELVIRTEEIYMMDCEVNGEIVTKPNEYRTKDKVIKRYEIPGEGLVLEIYNGYRE